MYTNHVILLYVHLCFNLAYLCSHLTYLAVCACVYDAGLSLDLVYLVHPNFDTDDFMQQLLSAKLHPLIVFIEVCSEKVRYRSNLKMLQYLCGVSYQVDTREQG